MSTFGIRNRLKRSLKKVLGVGPGAGLGLRLSVCALSLPQPNPSRHNPSRSPMRCTLAHADPCADL